MYDIHYTTKEFTAYDILKEIQKENIYGVEEVFIIFGGDGTMNQVVNAINDFNKTLIVPFQIGTGNDFNRGLNITSDYRKRIEKFIDYYMKDEIFNNKHIKDVDICELTYANNRKRKYIVSSGAGLDAEVVKYVVTTKLRDYLRKIGLAGLSYKIWTFILLFRANRFTAINSDTIYIASMNLMYEGGGVPMAFDADPYDNNFDFVNCYGLKPFNMLNMFLKLLDNVEPKSENYTVKKSKFIHIKFDKVVPLHTDGEYLGDYDEVEYNMCVDKLKIFI